MTLYFATLNMQFRRLAGGKKRKNWQESLNDIIDIKEADVKEEIKIYQKYHSEEAVNKLYKPDPVSESVDTCSSIQ